MTESFKITNVNIFDGQSFHKGDVAIANGLIYMTTEKLSTTIDGTGKYLIPGLIDCHIHLRDNEVLHKLARNGVTTALDMATWPPALFKSFKNQPGLPDIRSAGIPATSPGSQHSKIPGLDQYLVSDPFEADAWVKARVDEGSDYIKLVSDVPGPSQDLLNALVVAAHKYHKTVVIHASRKKAFEMALAASGDIITHLPIDQPLDDETVAKMNDGGFISVPTLTVDEGLSAKRGPPLNYPAAKASFEKLHKAGVPIWAGTDANATPICPIEHGSSMHHELKLMVEAGFSPIEALRSATEAPSLFGPEDRGTIQEGMRADLVLLSKNPLDDIENTKSIERVWIGGIEYKSH